MKKEKSDLGMDGFDPMTIPGSRTVSPRARAERTRGYQSRPAANPSDEVPRPEPRKREGAQPRQVKKKPADTRPGWLRLLCDARLHKAIGVLLVVLAGVVFIVTLSHLRAGAADQSAVEGLSITQMAEQNVPVANAGGPFGAKLSQWLFADGLGLGAFVLVLWMAMIGLSLLKFIKVNFWALTAKCMFTAIAVSIVCGLLTYNARTYVHWGGVHGHFVNEWLMGVGNVLLAVAVSVSLVGVLACIFLNEIMAAYKHVAGTVQRKREQWRKLHREDRDRKIQLHDIEKVEKGSAADAPSPVRHTLEENAETPNRVMPQHMDGTPSGFDIDDEIEGEADYTVRTRTPDRNPIKNDEPETSADLPEDLPEDPEASKMKVIEDDAPEEYPLPDEETEYAEADFVVRTAPTEDSFAIDEGEDVAEDLQDYETDGALTAADVANLPPFDPRAELSRYRFPDVNLLIERDDAPIINMEEQRANKDLIVKTLLDYKIPIDRIEATVGPTVTLYEVRPAEGVRIAQIKRLEDDIALSLSALGIRIIAPIPGKDVVGIEVPNRKPQIVSIRRVLDSPKFRDCNMRLPMAIGATISNEIFIADLAKMPHMLVAGATGQGKSVGLNCILASLLYKRHPSELKLVLIDPKMVEFSLYSKLERHYLAKLPDEEEAIVTDPLKAAATLHSLCIEMDNRYQLLKQAGVRNIEEYNDKFVRRRLNPEKGHNFMPYIVMVVDEFADLIMQAGKEVSVSIARIAQKARAVGMHMIIATQRPSTDVISGMIKNNFPGRIAFKVSQMVDSRTILDSPGANRLIGRGDMLFSLNSVMTRVQCALIETSEVEAICDHINDQIGFSSPFLLPEIPQEGGGASPDSGMVDLSKRDPMFDQCARFIVTQSTVSTSMLQRRFGIGYNKAGKIMDQMEAAGIVGPACGQRPRAILVDSITCEDIINNA